MVVAEYQTQMSMWCMLAAHAGKFTAKVPSHATLLLRLTKTK
jgi:hypothetical protein